MGVYIKGMEMPKNCYGCPFFTQVDYWNKDDEADILSKCKRTGEFTWESVNGYLPNCPLIPVPPHGRLIDADAFAAEMKKRQDACAEWRDDIKNGGGYGSELYYRSDSFLGAMCETKLTLDKMPTILPAEEGE